ncbi:hypothetical protein FRC00_009803 [Tulasnella sp. 408]|nr:hypothetical protein FRC00_009803 [Tulasnella sp. 408]
MKNTASLKAYFSGMSSSIKVHGGFQDTFKRSASSILTAVKKVMAAKSSSKVTLVGHSLGGALALLDSIYLKIQIPSITTKTVTLGVPRAKFTKAYSTAAGIAALGRTIPIYDAALE